MNSAPVVYVIHESVHNYIPAEAYGEIVFITSLDFSPIASSPKNARLFNDIKTVMRQYRPGVDFILSSGNPATIGLFMLSLGTKFGNVEHNFLRWDRHMEGYVLYKMSPLENAA